MWTRRELKERAKQVLKTSYWKAFLVSLLLALISGGLPSCSFNFNLGGLGDYLNGPPAAMPGGMDAVHTEWNGAILALVIIGIIMAVTFVLALFAFSIFVRYPLEVGVKQYFKKSAEEDVNLNYIGFSFARGQYLAIVKSMLWAAFLNFLWFLLLIVPGIVKHYAYSQVPYILSDNPRVGMKRAVELSQRMTRGQKWEMFVLDLSFIGWFLLGTIAFLVGNIFVWPYFNATKAELYLALRRRALDEGICSRAELELSNL